MLKKFLKFKNKVCRIEVSKDNFDFFYNILTNEGFGNGLYKIIDINLIWYIKVHKNKWFEVFYKDAKIEDEDFKLINGNNIIRQMKLTKII